MSLAALDAAIRQRDDVEAADRALDGQQRLLLNAMAQILAYLLRETAHRDHNRGELHHYPDSAVTLDKLRAPVLHHIAINREDAP